MARPDGVHVLVRRTHEENVLAALRERGALSRAEIGSLTGLSRTTLSEITGELLSRGAIVVVDTDASVRAGSGRPAERLALDPASGQFLGVDFSHGGVTVAVADATHEIVAAGSSPYTRGDDWPTRVRIAFELIDRLGAQTGVHYGDLQGIGLGVPGPYAVRVAPPRARESGWVRYDASDAVDQAFAERFGARIVIDNNTRFAALAEALRADGDSVRNLMYVRLSDGVGGGLVIDGRLVTGSNSVAGEFGHVTVEPGGMDCRCGKRGCLETVASVPAILARCRERGARLTSLEDLTSAVAVADPVVDGVLREVGEALGRVIGAAAVLLNPRVVVVAGEITRIAPVLLEQVSAALTYQAATIAQVAPIVRSSALGQNAGALGAVAALFSSTSPLLAGYATGASHPHLSDGARVHGQGARP